MSLPTSSTSRYAGAPEVPGYALVDFLGRGSGATVWSARHEGSGASVALKVVAPGSRLGAAALEGAEREVLLGSLVTSDHLVRVHERLVLPDGRVVLTLDLADGGSLRDVVTIRGALPLGEVVTALTPVATALADLHAAGVVHADVAPGNLLFTGDGRPMLGDLSSARLLDDGWPETLLGTSGFTAPEVLLGSPPGPASDVWSLGALVWFARTGGTCPPDWVGDLHWPHPSPPERGGPPGTAADVTAAVGPELRPLLVRMLAEDPPSRPTAAEVALALFRTAEAEPVGLVGRHPDPAAAVTTRIRREAAETRSRSELREAERGRAPEDKTPSAFRHDEPTAPGPRPVCCRFH